MPAQRGWHQLNRNWLRLSGLVGLCLLVGMTVHRLGAEEPAAVRVIPEGPLGDVIRLGEELVEQTATHPLSKPYVGNALHCKSCHLKKGTHPTAASFLGVATAYPAWSPREQRVITLEDRVLNCFMRSCHGIRPPLGSEVSVAITTYITWLSQGESLQMNGRSPKGPRAVPPLDVKALQPASVERGTALYAEHCSHCHGDDGAGDAENPPVWGAQSYNQGAGLANNPQLAAWLKVSMPLDDATLTPQEAHDIAAYVNSHDRPHFRLSEHLPPVERRGVYNGPE